MKQSYTTPTTGEALLLNQQVICTSPAPAPGRNSAGTLQKQTEQNIW